MLEQRGAGQLPVTKLALQPPLKGGAGGAGARASLASLQKVSLIIIPRLYRGPLETPRNAWKKRQSSVPVSGEAAEPQRPAGGPGKKPKVRWR